MTNEPQTDSTLPKSLIAQIALLLFILFIFTQSLYMIIEIDEQYEGKDPWKDWHFKPMKICERIIMKDFIREKSNSYSDFAYYFVGLLITAIGVYDHFFGEITATTSNIIKYPSITIMYGIHNIFHAVGSFSFHACTCSELNRYDAGMMFGVVSFPIFYVVYHQFDSFNFFKSQKSTHWIYILIHCLFGVLFLITKGIFTSAQQLTTIILLDLVFVAWFYYWNSKSVQLYYLILCCLTFIIGFGFWLLDIFGIYCFPDSPVQFHALWHTITSFSIFYLYYFFRSEKKSLE